MKESEKRIILAIFSMLFGLGLNETPPSMSKTSFKSRQVEGHAWSAQQISMDFSNGNRTPKILTLPIGSTALTVINSLIFYGFCDPIVSQDSVKQ